MNVGVMNTEVINTGILNTKVMNIGVKGTDNELVQWTFGQ